MQERRHPKRSIAGRSTESATDLCLIWRPFSFPGDTSIKSECSFSFRLHVRWHMQTDLMESSWQRDACTEYKSEYTEYTRRNNADERELRK